MTKADKKKAAARARAGKVLKHSSHSKTQILLVSDAKDIETDSDDNYDCGYEGGIDCVWSEDGSDSEVESDNGWSDASVDDDLIEVDEGELPPVKIPEIFTNPKMPINWKKAQSNRKLGYTGTSVRTRQRHDQQAREQEEFRQQAKTS